MFVNFCSFLFNNANFLKENLLCSLNLMVRLQLFFKAESTKKETLPDKFGVQRLLYYFINRSSFYSLLKTFAPKNFSFSDFFPMKHDEWTYSIVFASPNEKLINEIYRITQHYMNVLVFRNYILTESKLLKTNATRFLTTGSPIILVRNSDKKQYYSFRQGSMSIHEFDKLVKYGAIRRYRAFSGEKDFDFEGSLFDSVEFRTEVTRILNFNGKRFGITGSTWHKLILQNNEKLKKFFGWFIDAGSGQKTSLGFGFLRPYRTSKLRTSNIVTVIN